MPSFRRAAQGAKSGYLSRTTSLNPIHHISTLFLPSAPPLPSSILIITPIHSNPLRDRRPPATMVRQLITTYKMLTPQRRSEILAEIEAQHAVRIAIDLPPDTPEQDEAEQDAPKQEEAEQQAPDMEMEDGKTKDENEEEGQIRHGRRGGRVQGGPNGGGGGAAGHTRLHPVGARGGGKPPVPPRGGRGARGSLRRHEV